MCIDAFILFVVSGKMGARSRKLLRVVVIGLISTIALGLKIEIPAHIEDVFFEARQVAASGRDALFEFMPQVKKLRSSINPLKDENGVYSYLYAFIDLFNSYRYIYFYIFLCSLCRR